MSKQSLTAYCLSTKTKNVPFKGIPVINKTGNRYLLQGEDADGNKMAKIMGLEGVNEALKAGLAKKGKGWK